MDGKRIGCEITGVDVRALTDAEIERIQKSVYAHKLLVFRAQDIGIADYLAFARRLGRPQIYFQENYHHPEHPEIFVSSNILEGGKKVGVAGTGQYWHTDYQFCPEPLSTTLVYPQVLPRGQRETYYIDMVRAYERLPEGLRRQVDVARAVHEAKWRYKITAEDIDRSVLDVISKVEQWVPAVTHPAVIVHPVTASRSLYVSRGFSTGLVGLSHEENARVMGELFAVIEEEAFVHTHGWQYGDILYWDNRTLIHKASVTPIGEPSKSYRIGVYDAHAFYANGDSTAVAAA
jgi:taurine dioxygenase